MPAAVAARPRDERGYPVPAVTPWPDGRPEFARQGVPRLVICLDQRRCVVCGAKMSPGPVYRYAEGEVADVIDALLKRGKFYLNAASAMKFAGHRSSMIYALGHAACRHARLHAPTWQEIARAVRPYLPGLPPPCREAYAWALFAEAEEISCMTFHPAPYAHGPREEFQRALLTGTCQAIRRGQQVAAVRQGSDGIWEASDVRIPPACPQSRTAPPPRPPAAPRCTSWETGTSRPSPGSAPARPCRDQQGNREPREGR
jgi:hypothetical protein